MKLTETQTAILRRAFKHEDPHTYPLARREIVAQLVKKGLAQHEGTWTRYEWNRPVATLHRFSLTPAGKTLCATLFPST